MDSIVICSAKDEAPNMLEWVAYYRRIGFGRVLIATNNNTDMSVDLFRAMSQAFDWFDFFEHDASGYGVIPQVQAYGLARQWLADRDFQGIAGVFDADEFLHLYEAESISRLWEMFPDPYCLCINWRIFGSSGHRQKPAGLTIEEYTGCAEPDLQEHHQIKSIFRVEPELARFNAHYPKYRPRPRAGRTRNYFQMDMEPLDPLVLTSKPFAAHTRVVFRHAQVNHYIVKSAEEFRAKGLRGNGGRPAAVERLKPRHTPHFFRKMDRNECSFHFSQGFTQSVRAIANGIYDDARLGRYAPREYFFT